MQIIVYCRTFYPEAYILPVSEPDYPVDVFVGNIDAAAESNLAINDQYLTVITVI